MSECVGTRRKKISVLHMLGSWEGRIDGCNCPSCKEWDAGEKSFLSANRSPPKSPKGPRKVSIKVKTTKELAKISEESSTLSKKQISPKHTLTVKTSKFTEQLDDSAEKFDCLNEVQNISTDDNDEQGHHSLSDSMMGDGEAGENVQLEVNQSGDTEAEEITKEKDQHAKKHNFNSTQTTNSKNSVTPEFDNKEGKSTDEIGPDEPPKIKQEPEEYFSDEEMVQKPVKRKYYVCREPRISKRAKMVTSEIENVYAKPRMIFTGRGVVRKFEPGLDKTPKSRRGRKPGKLTAPVKVKVEPKETEGPDDGGEDDDGGDMDQLQRALSEAAENISDVGDEFFDAFHEFSDDSKKGGRPKRRNNALFKRVDTDGDKYVECTMCFKMLKESSMKQHFKTHTGQKPHTCNECDARFTRKGDVERHKRLVHKNQKPFKCQKCNKEFSDRKNLKAHLQNHDKAIYYACNTCGFKFGKREYYENHIRYIHPLPDGSVPAFADSDEDLALRQLKQIELEERREKRADKAALAEARKNLTQEEYVLEESDKAIEVTLTVGEEQNAASNSLIIKKEIDNDNDADIIENEEDEEELEDQVVSIDSGKADEASENSSSSLKPEVGTDVKISKGTLSFTQTVPDTDSQDEDLVDKVIAAAVSQATNTIESLQAKSGANMSGNDVDLVDEEEDEDELLEEADDIQEIFDSTSCDMLPIAQVPKQTQPPTEIHINASVSGQQRKFIIQVPPGTNLNVQTPEGMEMIVSIVNQLCAGKGELDGPIEVTMHNPNNRMMVVKKR